MVETTPRTTTRKPRAKAAVSSESVPKPAVRRSTRKVVAAEDAPVRKAPTAFVSRERTQRSNLIYVGIGIFLLLAGVSAGIGMTAQGQINVENAMIAQISEHPTNPDGTPVQLPSQHNDQVVNSGLVPATDQPEPAPPVMETASSTESASSTEATSTEPITSEVAEASTAEGEVAGAETSTPEEPVQ